MAQFEDVEEVAMRVGPKLEALLKEAYEAGKKFKDEEWLIGEYNKESNEGLTFEEFIAKVRARKVMR